jgi:hypothetical protein
MMTKDAKKREKRSRLTRFLELSSRILDKENLAVVPSRNWIALEYWTAH